MSPRMVEAPHPFFSFFFFNDLQVKRKLELVESPSGMITRWRRNQSSINLGTCKERVQIFLPLAHQTCMLEVEVKLYVAGRLGSQEHNLQK